jgi:hypothetical protein
MNTLSTHEYPEVLRDLSDWLDESQTAELFDLDTPELPHSKEIILEVLTELVCQVYGSVSIATEHDGSFTLVGSAE